MLHSPSLRNTQHQFNSEKGFTLIELLVVIMLISLVTAFTIPAIRTNLFTDPLKSASRRLVGLITEVSQDAIRHQTEYQLKFDMEKNHVSAVPKGKSSSDDVAKDRRLEFHESVRIVDIESSGGGKLLEDEASLYISKKGYVDKTAIHLSSDDGRDMTIVLSPFMGAIKIFDSYRDLEDDRIQF